MPVEHDDSSQGRSSSPPSDAYLLAEKRAPSSIGVGKTATASSGSGAGNKGSTFTMSHKSEYLMGFAVHAATASKDSTKVGAILVDQNGTIRMTGYNGPPKGVRDLPQRFERPAKYLFASHAEANLIAFCARAGIATEGCKVYVTHLCCASCARTLIQAGITAVVFGPGETSMPPEEFEAAKTMFREAGVSAFLLP